MEAFFVQTKENSCFRAFGPVLVIKAPKKSLKKEKISKNKKSWSLKAN